MVKRLHYISLFVLLTLFFIPFWQMFFVSFVDGHDFLLHFHMIYALEAYIKKGILLPRYLPDATYGYGSPILTYMWGVPYYLGAILHMIGLSYPAVFKFLLIFPNVVAGIGMYKWMKSHFGAFIGGVASVIYVWNPYRFVDTFKRGDIGELFFFAFLPFIFYIFDSKLSRAHLIYGILLTALLIYSHQGLSLLGFVMLLSYMGLKFILKKDKNILLRQLAILLGGLILSAFFWVPAIAYHSLLPFGKSIEQEWFPPLVSLIRSPWEGGMVAGRWLIFSYQIGIAQLLIIFLSHLLFIFNVLKKDKKRLQISFWLVLFWIAVFFMQPISNFFWLHIPLIAYLQFPFRLLFIPMLASSVLISFLLSSTSGTKRYIFGILISLLVLYANRNHLGVLAKDINMSQITSYNGTYDVGGEKIPKYADVNVIYEEYKKNIDNGEFSIIEGDGKILNQKREDYKSYAQVELATDGNILVRRIYFPGWNVFVDGKKIPENEYIKGNGIIIVLKKGLYDIKVQYDDPRLVKISNTISFAFLSAMIILLGRIYLKEWILALFHARIQSVL